MNPQGEPAPGGMIPPQPTPMTFRVFTVPAGNDLVVIEVHHAAGTFVAFLDDTSAQAMAEQLAAAAAQAGSGLTVVSSREVRGPVIKGRG